MRLEGHSLGTVKMSKNINPLDHVSNPLHAPAELIMKQVCPGPRPIKLGEVSLDKEVPIHKMCSPCTARNPTVRGTSREEPTTTCASKTPPASSREAWELCWLVCCLFCVVWGYESIGKRLKIPHSTEIFPLCFVNSTGPDDTTQIRHSA